MRPKEGLMLGSFAKGARFKHVPGEVVDSVRHDGGSGKETG